MCNMLSNWMKTVHTISKTIIAYPSVLNTQAWSVCYEHNHVTSKQSDQALLLHTAALPSRAVLLSCRWLEIIFDLWHMVRQTSWTSHVAFYMVQSWCSAPCCELRCLHFWSIFHISGSRKWHAPWIMLHHCNLWLQYCPISARRVHQGVLIG